MLLLLAFALWFGSTEHAFAYLDPGTGSILLQAIIGGPFHHARLLAQDKKFVRRARSHS
jgi:hypothetical protein